MTALAPAAWWRGIGGLTRSGRPAEGMAWALYDFANTIFSFAIVSFAMGPWTTRFLGEGPGTLWFTVAVSVAVGLNAIVSPILGAMSDRVGQRKGFLLFFTGACVVATALIGLVDIRIGLIVFALANFAYQAALIYYDALLPDVARDGARGRLSGIAVALGYTGTIVSGLLYALTTDAQGRTTAISFLLIASLFAVFAMPLFLLVRELPRQRRPFRLGDAARSWSQVAATISDARRHPGLLRFIVARFFYSDPANTTIAVMSLFAINAVGFAEAEARFILIGLTVIAILASLGWGWLVEAWGPRRTLFTVLWAWVVGLAIAGLVLEPIPFLVAGAFAGAGLGGLAVTDRLYLLRLSPPAQVGEMFGLYGLAGKASAVVGPLLYGVIVFMLEPTLDRGAYQVAIVSLLGLLFVGMVLLRGVPEGRDAAPDLGLPQSAS
ncbi:MAG: MFS transporter [Candidatus Limnocylindria bacterium]